ncbi:Acetyltransferase (GNAT) domain-containing protein [Bosea sp. 62]|uniref:GNAT family N-acetyltransferase n=1 Tax=unclassified Bosea (in: a-proteobacteria) TaxID=2653178 RepID=UPI00125107BE|nr:MULTISPECIES: GNAT family N-acetyltransferase [unclassified Bosea (in: a-proteobacteria)]CAD5245984.1 Acetyltransferase (GNAT) domain-containing protein [Bosea sp. 46]CAD5247947.1 Acetyltransferase (GNAT) domain-containing protein [Bosea sp. 21B]CAD5267982.1 Acetyltransferase (GNAT) domain-containing protein [Bosea sp. 7B]VVT45654.1 Acetyltransferase (GNAT) domain-containing protein [Bosea sp. EC-HK365B]VXA92979.1 Acetyltransferase (GNAT) domain-containing protein [Bosea sp. 125]
MTASIAVRRLPAGTYGAVYAEAFADLCRRAEAPNLHMAPAAVAAALSFGIANDDIVVLAAHASDGEDLLGLWALRRTRSLHSGLVPVLEAPLVSLYEVSSAPVLDRGRAHDAAAALILTIAEAPDLPKILKLPLLPMQGNVFAALESALAATGSSIATFERWQRPMLVPEPGDDAERYLRRALGQGYKKRMQQHRQLEKAGTLAYQRHRGAEAIATLEDFLALEAAGWKGRGGTALTSLARDGAYIREIIGNFAAADAIRVDLLRLDDQPIAGGLLLDLAGQSHFLKIAYDEGKARLSPGRALAIAMLRADFAAGRPFLLDSGAGDRVDPSAYPWGERQEMANAIVALAGHSAALPKLAAAARMRLRHWRDRSPR